jgi:hypothetical protein
MGSPQHTRRHRSRGSCTHHHTVSTSYCCFLTMSLFHRFAAPVTKTVHAARVQVGWDGVHQCASPCRCTTPAAQRVPVHTCTSRLHCCTWVWPLRACAGAARFQVPMHTQPCMSFNHHDAHNITVCKACTARALEGPGSTSRLQNIPTRAGNAGARAVPAQEPPQQHTADMACTALPLCHAACRSQTAHLQNRCAC